MKAKSDMTVPLLISAAVHLLVIGVLLAGFEFDSEPKPLPQVATQAPAAGEAPKPIVKAVMVDQQKVAAQVEKFKQQQRDERLAEQKRQQQLEREANEAKKARQREQQRIRELEQQRKQQEIATKKANEAAKAAKLKEQQQQAAAAKAEQVRKQKEQEQKAAEVAAQKAAEKRKQEELAAKKAAEERKRKAEAERKRLAEEKARQEQEQQMQDALAAEQAALSQTRNRQINGEVARYTAMIQATIKRNLVIDESMRNKSCRVNIRLAKDGFVTSTRTLSGDSVVCRAATAAINKAGRLPVSPDADVYNKLKEINLTVKPEFN